MAGSVHVDDALWELAQPLLPDRTPQRTGRPRVSDRAAFTTIVFVLVPGVAAGPCTTTATCASAGNAGLPFKWITPGGFTATMLMLVSSVALSLYATNFGCYDQIYGQLGAVVVLMLWLYVVELTMLIGVEMNAVLARMAEEKKGVTLVQAEDGANT